jgi:hypothetical protein
MQLRGLQQFLIPLKPTSRTSVYLIELSELNLIPCFGRFLYGVIFTGEAIENKTLSEPKKRFTRNVCVFADGQIDRCPTGTGVSARVALEFSKGEMAIDEELVVESIIGTIFRARISDFVETDHSGTLSLSFAPSSEFN